MKLRNGAHGRRFVLIGLVAATSWLLAACDSGRGIDAAPAGSGPAIPGPIVSGIEGTGVSNTSIVTSISVGPIESKDGLNIRVNDVNWAIDNASVSIEGVASSPTSLEPGMLVSVTGVLTSPDSGSATTVETVIAVRGAITGLDTTTRQLTILGQSISTRLNTIFHVPGARFDSLYLGQVVSVSGFVDTQGAIEATLISIPPPDLAETNLILGQITSVDSAARQLAINGLNVDHSGARILRYGAQSGSYYEFLVGQWLTVIGHGFTDTGALDAETILFYSPLPTADASLDVAVTNRVWRVLSAGEFELAGGLRVIVPAEVMIENGTLAANVMVHVDGTVSSPGVVTATKVTVIDTPPPWWEIVGDIDAIRFDSPDSAVLRVLGVDINIDSSTRIYAWDDFRSIPMTQLSVGERVTIELYRDGPAFFVGRWMLPLNRPEPVTVAGEYFRSISPPDGFTIYGFADFAVQVRPDTRFFYADREPTFDYGCERCVEVPPTEFWRLAALPKPANSSTYVMVWADYDGSSILAQHVYLHVAGTSPY